MGSVECGFWVEDFWEGGGVSGCLMRVVERTGFIAFFAPPSGDCNVSVTLGVFREEISLALCSWESECVFHRAKAKLDGSL